MFQTTNQMVSVSCPPFLWFLNVKSEWLSEISCGNFGIFNGVSHVWTDMDKPWQTYMFVVGYFAPKTFAALFLAPSWAISKELDCSVRFQNHLCRGPKRRGTTGIPCRSPLSGELSMGKIFTPAKCSVAFLEVNRQLWPYDRIVPRLPYDDGNLNSSHVTTTYIYIYIYYTL